MSVYQIILTKSFKKDFKKLSKSGSFNNVRLGKVVDTLSEGRVLDRSYKDHELTGNLKGFRECHIENDLLLIYQKEENMLILVLIRIGSHSALFR